MSDLPPAPEPGEESADPTPKGDRGSFGLIRDRSFGPYFAAHVAAATGVWIYNIVAAVVVFDLSGSALQVGMVSVAQFLPQAVLAPWAGARADRGNRTRQLLIGRIMSGCGGCSLAAWLAVAGDSGVGGALPVIGASVLVGIGFAIAGPAVMAILPALVRPSELGTAMALNQAPYTVARSVGPAIGTLLLVVSGPVMAFAVAGLSSVAHGVAAARAHLRPQPRDFTGDRSVRAGLRYLRVDPVCARLLIAVTALGFALDPLITLMPPLAAQLGGDHMVGLLVATFGVGSMVVIPGLGAIRRRMTMERLGPLGLGLFAAGYVVVTFATATTPVLVALLAAGVGMMLSITALSTLLQQRLPEALRGRIMALWFVAFLGSRPLAAAINGTVADLVSVGAAFGLMALVLLAGIVVARPGSVARPPFHPAGEEA